MMPYYDAANLAEFLTVVFFQPKRATNLFPISYLGDSEINVGITLTKTEIAEHMTDKFGPVRSFHPREQRIDDVMDAPLQYRFIRR